MMRSLWIAASGMQSQEMNIDVIANNLANVNTSGFKRGRVDFQDLMYQMLRMPGTMGVDGSIIPTGIQLGQGSRPVAIQKIFVQGDYQETGNELDLAIEGHGFFRVTLPDGETGYTRAGAFKKDSEGRICSSEGYLIEPAITLPEDTIKVSVDADGTVSVLQSGQTTTTEVGTIELATCVNPAGLIARGKNLFLESDASGVMITGAPGSQGLGTIAQGYLEMSNVSVVEEMVNMIAGQRAYESSSKAIQAADDMLQMANNLRR
jgi:flagellar basal-body rod protein FlgG